MEKNIMLMTLIIAVVFFIVGNPFTYAYVSKFTGLKVKNKKQHLMLVAIHSVVMSLVMFGVLSSLVIDKECPPPPPPKKCPPPPPPKKCPTCEKENDQPTNGDGQLSNGNGQPKNGNGQPKNGNDQPKNGNDQPSNSNGLPSNGNGQPSDGSTIEGFSF